jgi:PIN domain nuclease of toxin-antitoxin system
MEELRVVYLDTNVLIWLYEGRTGRLGKSARRAINKWNPIASAAVLMELEILYEVGRAKVRAEALIGALAQEIGLEICTLPFRAIVEHALSEAWTRDPWDRLIVANAKAARAQLVTADEKIRQHYSRAIWD